MAGIGFELRKLFKDRTGFGYAKAYAWTGMVTTGPFFIMAFLVLSVQLLYDFFEISPLEKNLYVMSVVYSFLFSQIVGSGFTMVATRFVADKLYVRDVGAVISSLYGIIACAITAGAVFGIAFFAWASLDFFLELTTYIFYLEMMLVLILNTYVSALHNYTYIVGAYAYGMLTSVIGTWLMLMCGPREYALVGTMAFMDLGAFVIVALLFRNIYLFFGEENYRYFDFIDYFSTKKILFATSFLYALGLYAHSFIIWLGPMGVCLAETYYFQPPYDVSTFFAYLSILPSMMLFVVTTEINFYGKFRRYLMFITTKGNYKEISDSRDDMVSTLWAEIRNIFDFQLVSAFCFIAVGNVVLPQFGLAFYGVDIYNLLVLSAFCVAIVQAVLLMLLYLEDRTGAFLTACILFVTGVIFNLMCIYVGESSYGLGAFASSFVTMVFALIRLHLYSKHIDYHMFCSQPVLNAKGTGFFVRLHDKLYKEDAKDDE